MAKSEKQRLKRKKKNKTIKDKRNRIKRAEEKYIIKTDSEGNSRRVLNPFRIRMYE